MDKKVIAFVDGENLVFRYQELLESGRTPQDGVVHIQDSFVWSRSLANWCKMNLLRINYYTSVVGSHEKVEEVQQKISETQFSVQNMGFNISPRVFKKQASSRKTKIVDINLTIDLMRAAYEMPIDAIWLLSGDGDFLPIISEVNQRTSKQIYLSAFSSGLAPSLKNNVEVFLNLDSQFFK